MSAQRIAALMTSVTNAWRIRCLRLGTARAASLMTVTAKDGS